MKQKCVQMLGAR